MHAIKTVGVAVVVLTACAIVGCGPTTNLPAGAAPPPAAAGQPDPLRSYDFSHKLRVDPKRRLGQYWTVAILRFGDTRQMEDVPFGAEEEKEKKPTGSEVNVEVKVGTSGGGHGAAPSDDAGERFSAGANPFLMWSRMPLTNVPDSAVE